MMRLFVIIWVFLINCSLPLRAITHKVEFLVSNTEKGCLYWLVIKYGHRLARLWQILGMAAR